MVTEKLKTAYRFSEIPRELLKKRVIAYTNPGLIKKYGFEKGISEEAAAVAFTELKKFLYICGVTNEALTPSAGVDDIWHQFILFTGDYMRFCNRYFNQMIHHTPDTEFDHKTKSANNLAYERAYDIALEEFGPLDPDFWVSPNLVNAAKCSDDDQDTSKCSSKCSNVAKCSN